MNDLYTYLIQLRGQLDADMVNTLSPLQVTLRRSDTNTTLLAVHSDQAGLIGLLRHMHGLGFVLIALRRSSDRKIHEEP